MRTIFVFVYCIAQFVSCRFIKPPPDDCPGIFEYQTRRSDQYKYAIVTIEHPPPLGTTLDLVVRISVEGRLFKVILILGIYLLNWSSF